MISFRSKSPLNERLVTLHRFSDSQEILLAMTIKTGFAEVFGSRLASVYSLESLASFCIVALYLDMIHFSLSEIYVGILQNTIADLNLVIAEKMFSNRVSILIEEVLVLFDGLFGMPATSSVSEEISLARDLTYRKSVSPSERIR
jgi:hypothetical protein